MALTQSELDSIAAAITPAVTAGVLATMNNLSVTPVASAVQALLTASTEGGIRRSINLGNAKDFGAVGDGTTNDRAAFVAADTAASSNGGAIRLPAGTYLVSTSLTLSRQVVFEAGARLKPASGQTITLSAGFVANDSQYIFDTSAGGLFSVTNRSYTPEMFGAVGDGTTNDAPAFAAMVNSIYRTGRVELSYSKTYRINSTITIDGLQKTILFSGTTGGRSIVPGGSDIATTPTITWGGSAGTSGSNQVIFDLRDGHGTSFDGISFQTISSAQGTIDIDYVTAIRFTNTVSTRFSAITRCEFWRLRGIHFYDLGSVAANDFNMDGHTIQRCQFYVYRDAIKIEQSNAYDTAVNHCAFYGDPNYTKYHLWIAKGYAYASECYWGKIKGASSVGGKNGTAIFIQNGCIRLDKAYSETDDGPFLDWESPAASTDVLSIAGGTGIMQTTASLPSTWSVRNQTTCIMSISDIHITGNLRQSNASGCISVSGTYQPVFEGTLSRCFYNGNFLGSNEGLIGSAAGTATIFGPTPTLTKTLSGGSKVNDKASLNGSSQIVLDHVDVPGYRAGVKYNANTGQIDLRYGGWGFVKTIPSYADNAAALAGGLTAGQEYHTAGVQKIVT